MSKARHTVMGVHAPSTRPTLYGLFVLASVVSLPVGGILCLLQVFFM